MKPVPPEYYRVKIGMYATPASYGNAGMFLFPHYKVKDYEIVCMISDMEGWEHVSVTIKRKGKEATRCPTWEEMCWVKSQFWEEEECVIEYHPPKSEYVSCHAFCLHLWKPIGITLPLPDSLMVGLPAYKK